MSERRARKDRPVKQVTTVAKAANVDLSATLFPSLIREYLNALEVATLSEPKFTSADTVKAESSQGHPSAEDVPESLALAFSQCKAIMQSLTPQAQAIFSRITLPRIAPPNGQAVSEFLMQRLETLAQHRVLSLAFPILLLALPNQEPVLVAERLNFMSLALGTEHAPILNRVVPAILKAFPHEFNEEEYRLLQFLCEHGEVAAGGLCFVTVDNARVPNHPLALDHRLYYATLVAERCPHNPIECLAFVYQIAAELRSPYERESLDRIVGALIGAWNGWGSQGAQHTSSELVKVFREFSNGIKANTAFKVIEALSSSSVVADAILNHRHG